MRFFLALLLALPLLACGGGEGSDGETFVVTNLFDAGPGSLRQALLDAEDDDTITFEGGLAGAIVLTSGSLVIDQEVRIEGPGANLLGIEGGGDERAFQVEIGANAAVRGLSVRNTGAATGGGFQVRGSLTLEEVILDGCEVEGTGRGGGVHCVGGTLVMRRSLVKACRAYNGAGIACDSGVLYLEGCTLTENETTGNVGGGMLISSSVATIVNSTISGNSTTGSDRGGGGIAVFASGADDSTCRLASCTVAINLATGAGGGVYLGPSGVGTARVELRNSIVARNTAASGRDIDATDAFAEVLSGGNNVVGDGTGSGLVDGVLGDQVGTLAAPLNSGIVPLTTFSVTGLTHPLSASSPAVDAVPTALCRDFGGAALTSDQRGQARPAGPACDAGSHERQATEP